MLEIVGLIFLCNINKKNAAALGKSGGGAIALTIGLWVGLEFLGALIGNLAELGIGAYLLALVFAAVGAVTSYAIAKTPSKKPGAGQIVPGGGRQYPAQAAVPQYQAYAVNPQAEIPPQNKFCVRCGRQLAPGAVFCGICGAPVTAVVQPPNPMPQPVAAASPVTPQPSFPQAAAVPAVPPASAETVGPRNVFYAFAVQGPAFGVTGDGDIVMEKAGKLKADYEPAKDMDLKVIRPGQWNADIQSGNTGGMISVSYNFGNFKDRIREYLLREGIPGETIENGIRLCDENSLQLSNPMSGVYVMGIPVIFESFAAAEPQVQPAPGAAPQTVFVPCAHEFRHFVCVKCGEKAPKPQLASQGTRRQNQHIYEDYTAGSAEEARYFLEQTAVTAPLYYVMVHTPEGDWGRDKDGIFLSRLCDFQRDLSLRQCDAETALVPERMADVQMAANKVTDNYLLSVTCGACGYGWTDGVGYRTKTVVKCPECGKYNLADTEHIRFNNL